MRSWRPFLRSSCNSEKLEMPSSPSDHQFAVDQRGLGRQLGDGFGDGRKFLGPVEPAAGEQLHFAAIEPRLEAIAVEFDLVNPVAAVRRFVRERRQGTARRKRAGRSAAPWTVCRAHGFFGAPQDRCHARLGRASCARCLSRLFCRVFFAAPLAISSIERPLATERGFCSRMSLSPGPRAASSCALISSQLSRFSPRLRCMRTRCQQPVQLLAVERE